MANSVAGIIDIDVDTSDVESLLRRMDTAISDFGLAMFMNMRVHPYLQTRAKNRFKNEGDDVVGKWAPLLPATEKIRIRSQYPIGGASPINRRSDELMNYITGTDSAITSVAGVSILKFPGTAPTGELAEKVKTAQRGKNDPKTVSRPVLGVGLADLEFTTLQLALHISEISAGVTYGSATQGGLP